MIHYQINQLEAFRNQTMHQAKSASSNSREVLTRRFERLNNVIEGFEQYYVGLARNILSLVQAGRREVVVKLVKIAEVEGKEDEKVLLVPPYASTKTNVVSRPSQFVSLKKPRSWTQHRSSSLSMRTRGF